MEHTISIKDVQQFLELQCKYDELIADCKDLLNVVINLSEEKGEPTMVLFNDPNGYPSIILNFIRNHATWSKSL